MAHRLFALLSSARSLPMTVLLFYLLAGGNASSLRADEAPVAERPAAQAPLTDDEREADKQQRATAGLMALCGILIGGLMFLALVMIWGARLRRLARRELPAQKTLQNDLWFLKPPKSPRE